MVVKENSKINTSEKSGFFKFFREIKAEVSKITWPSKSDTKKAFTSVIVVVVMYMILVGGLDFVYKNFFEFLFKLLK